MADRYNYATIEVDDSKPPDEYHYTERRAELLRIIIRSGGVHRVNQAQLGERYGVSRQQIHKDVNALSESVAETMGDNINLQTESAFQRIYDELLEDGEYTAAWRVFEGYSKLLERRGRIETEPERHEIDATHRQASTETDHYAIVPDDEADAVVEVPAADTPEAEADDAE